MRDGDFSACDRLAAVSEDTAAQTGGGVLREGRRSRQSDEQAERELGHADAIGVGHCRNLVALNGQAAVGTLWPIASLELEIENPIDMHVPPG